jgi:rod shape-determining protein MreD
MTYVYSFFWLIISLLLQVLVFNRLSIWGGVSLVYIYVLAKFPVDMNRSLQVIVGFLTGLVVDIFCNTPGMHALAAATAMWLRIPILRMFVDAQDFNMGVPGIQRPGLAVFSKYILALFLFHILLLYLIEAFSLFQPGVLFTKITVSLILTYVISLSLEVFQRN